MSNKKIFSKFLIILAFGTIALGDLAIAQTKTSYTEEQKILQNKFMPILKEFGNPPLVNCEGEGAYPSCYYSDEKADNELQSVSFEKVDQTKFTKKAASIYEINEELEKLQANAPFKRHISVDEKCKCITSLLYNNQRVAGFAFYWLETEQLYRILITNIHSHDLFDKNIEQISRLKERLQQNKKITD